MGATCHKKVDWLQEQTEKSLGATMSRSYLLMVGGDLLLAISLLMVVNVLIIGSVISPETFALIDPVHLGVMCLALQVPNIHSGFTGFIETTSSCSKNHLCGF